MTKLESKLNNLYQKLIERWNDLSKEDQNYLNLTAFLYSVDRLNELESILRLNKIAQKYYTEEQIEELIK